MNTSRGINLNPDGTINVPEQNGYLTEKHRRIAEILRDYDPTLELLYLPPHSRSALDTKPFAVVCRPPNARPYYVLFAEDADERLLARVFAADNRDKSVLGEMEKMNAAKELIMMKEQMDAMNEAHALAASIFRSRKIHYKHGGVDFGELG